MNRFHIYWCLTHSLLPRIHCLSSQSTQSESVKCCLHVLAYFSHVILMNVKITQTISPPFFSICNKAYMSLANACVSVRILHCIIDKLPHI